jgi:hypothetical protein
VLKLPGVGNCMGYTTAQTGLHAKKDLNKYSRSTVLYVEYFLETI